MWTLQEAYFSPIEVNERLKSQKIKLFPPIMGPNPLIRIPDYHFFQVHYSNIG